MEALEGPTTATAERALKFLGEGHSLEVTAAACGVTLSRVSQLLADENFAARVASARYASLLRASDRTQKYEKIEDSILDKLEKSLCMIFDPLKLARLLQVISAAKPKNVFTPSDLPAAQPTVALNIPQVVVNRFTTNIFNQVVEVIEGNSDSNVKKQTLVTIQSKALDALAKSRLPTAEKISEEHHEHFIEAKELPQLISSG